MPPKLVGKPLHENSWMHGSLTAAANDYILLVGDFSQFVAPLYGGRSLYGQNVARERAS